MIKEREYHEDEKTVLLDHQGQVPAQGPLTDFAEPPRFEQLEERMIYAARLRPGEAFNVSLNPLVAAASNCFRKWSGSSTAPCWRTLRRSRSG